MKTKWTEWLVGLAVSAALFHSASTLGASAEPAFSQGCAAGPEEVADYPVPIQWNDGLLQFACARLNDVVEEYNRPSSVEMVVRDGDLGNVLVGGAFKTEDTEAFTNGLEKVFGLRTHRRGNTVRISRGEEALSL